MSLGFTINNNHAVLIADHGEYLMSLEDIEKNIERARRNCYVSKPRFAFATRSRSARVVFEGSARAARMVVEHLTLIRERLTSTLH